MRLASAAEAAPAAAHVAPLAPVAPLPTAAPLPAKRIPIDQLRLRNSGYMPEEGQQIRFAEYYRELKRPLIQKALSANTPETRLIMVSSALPGDGKTFTSINLALSMARERDLSIVLVDADVPKAHISNALNMQDERGLTDSLLDDSLDVESLILGTDINSLTVLPAGRPTTAATELIASSRMNEVVARLARHPRRLVVLDSPPLLISSEARALVQIPAQLVLVARAHHTPRQALLDAIAKVDKRNLHLVLNDAPVSGSDSYYGYYGYYGENMTRGKPPAGTPR
jgi:protein-tyrosine kinase